MTLGFELLDLTVLITLFCLVRRTVWTEPPTAAAAQDDKKVVPPDDKRKIVPALGAEKKLDSSRGSTEKVDRKMGSQEKVVPDQAEEENKFYPGLCSVVEAADGYASESVDVVATKEPLLYR